MGAKAQLPRESVGAPSLWAFKARLDRALRSLSSRVAALPAAGDWKVVIFRIPSNPSHSTTLRIVDLDNDKAGYVASKDLSRPVLLGMGNKIFTSSLTTSRLQKTMASLSRGETGCQKEVCGTLHLRLFQFCCFL